MALIVRQTREAFKYPAGTEWGPYADMADALARKQMLQRYGSDGRIVYTPAAPCAIRRPKGEGEAHA